MTKILIYICLLQVVLDDFSLNPIDPNRSQVFTATYGDGEDRIQSEGAQTLSTMPKKVLKGKQREN